MTAQMGRLTGKTVVFTGTLDQLTRNEAEELASKLGAGIGSSVTQTKAHETLLVAGTGAEPKTLKDAKKFNVVPMDEGSWLSLAGVLPARTITVRFAMTKSDGGELPDFSLLPKGKKNLAYILSCMEFDPCFDEVAYQIDDWRLLDSGLREFTFKNDVLNGHPTPVVEFSVRGASDDMAFLRGVWTSSYRLMVPELMNGKQPFFFEDFNGYAAIVPSAPGDKEVGNKAKKTKKTKKIIDLKASIAAIKESEEDSVSKEVYENPDLYLALIAEETDYSGVALIVQNYMPDSLRSNRDLMETLIRHDAQLYEVLGAPLNDDKGLLELALSSDLDLFRFAGAEVSNDRSIVGPFLKKWLREKPESLMPISWLPLSLVKELKFIESAGLKSMPRKPGYNRFVIQVEQWDFTESKAKAAARHGSFVQAVIKDKNAQVFDELIQRENSDGVKTFSFLYLKGMTLEDLNDYFNSLAAKKVPAASTTVYDLENPNYMNYQDGEISSGSIDSDEADEDRDVYKGSIEYRNLGVWPIKYLDPYQ